MSDEIIASCAHCDEEISEDDTVYCQSCYDDEPRVEYIQRPADDCRRCGQHRFLNEAGYCSSDCELGLTPMPYQKAS